MGVLDGKEERFVKIYTQGVLQGFQIWVDRVTGVNYLVGFFGEGSGVTPLLDGDGQVVITDVDELDID